MALKDISILAHVAILLSVAELFVWLIYFLSGSLNISLFGQSTTWLIWL